MPWSIGLRGCTTRSRCSMLIRTSAAGLDADELDTARARAIASVIEADSFRWDPSGVADAAQDGWIGLLLLDGLMIRQVTVGKRSGCEIFGPGDVIRPWDADGDYDPLTITVAWLVLEPTRLAVLDTAFCAAHRPLAEHHRQALRARRAAGPVPRPQPGGHSSTPGVRALADAVLAARRALGQSGAARRPGHASGDARRPRDAGRRPPPDRLDRAQSG